MNPSAPAFASLFFFCLLLLLLPAQYYGASSHASYKIGSRQFFFKTHGNLQQASTVAPATTCSSITTGLGNKKVPIVHRQSPCSPLHGLPSLTTADALRRDASLIQRRFASKSSAVASPSPAPAPSPAATTIPTNGSSDPLVTPPGALDYSVLVGYGTPGQQFPVFLDTSFGTSVLRCKACGAGGSKCDPAFDWTRSTTFAHVPCGSPDCPAPAANCSGFACPFHDPTSGVAGSFAKDVLALAPAPMAAAAAAAAAVVHDFRFVCVNARSPSPLPEAGTLDLSRDRNSLPSRLSSSPWPATAAFSYCLPKSPSSPPGFLSFGAAAVGDDDDNRTVHAPLVRNDGGAHPELASMYFIDLAGISLGGEDLPVPPGTFGGGSNGNGNGSRSTTILEVGTTFTMLAPAVYALLRDAFTKDMAEYPAIPNGFAGFDTCYNFTGLHELTVPLVRFKFGNGESLLIDGGQMLYHDDPTAGPFTVACLAFSALDVSGGGDVFSAVIGSYTLTSTEVVYDVVGGKVGFIPGTC